MKTLAIWSIVLAALLSVALAAGLWTSGYFIVLAPFGVLSPFAELALFLALILLAVASAALLLAGKRPLPQRVLFVLCVMAMASLPWAAPWQLQGFQSRIKQMSDAEWLQIADDARDLIRASTADGQLPRGPDHNWNRQYVAQLVDSHDVLGLGDFPPKLFVSEDAVGIYWGSGLIGTLAVEVYSAPTREEPVSGGFHKRKSLSDHVALVWD